MASSRGYGAPAYFSTALGGARKIAPAPDFTDRKQFACGCFDESSFGGSHPLRFLRNEKQQPRKSGTVAFGVLERIRTSDPSLRRRVLYPAELRRRILFRLLILAQTALKVNSNLLFFGFFGIISSDRRAQVPDEMSFSHYKTYRFSLSLLNGKNRRGGARRAALPR